MDRNEVLRILQCVKDGKIELDAAVQALNNIDIENIGYARIDHQRTQRKGFPEVIYADGKQPDQVAEIAERLFKRNDKVLITRACPNTYQVVKQVLPEAVYQPIARTITVCRGEMKPQYGGYVAILSAGTSDMPVAEEAAITLSIMGHQVRRIYDVGVAGIHRLLAEQKQMAEAHVLIVVAGMEGALASVVGGLTDRPIIAVPTSVGYGANLGGLAPLLTMLNSCASGVTVVNIDNGFGAGYAAALINTLIANGGCSIRGEKTCE